MTNVVVFAEVDDVDKWLKATERQRVLKPPGIIGKVFTDSTQSSRVALLLEVPDMPAFEQFAAGQDATTAQLAEGVRPGNHRHPCGGFRSPVSRGPGIPAASVLPAL
jgi:hypothetical protein